MLSKDKKINILIILALLFIGFLIRSFDLSHSNLVWFDEGQVQYAAKLISKGWIPYRDFAFDHAPLLLYFYALFHKQTFSLLQIRLVATILSVMAIIPLYLLALKIFHRKSIAIIASSMLLIDPSHIFYSRFAILDPILTTLIAFSIYFLVLKNKIAWIFSGFFMGLAFLTKHTATAIFFTILFIVLFFFEKKDYKKRLFYSLTGFLPCGAILFIFFLEIPNFAYLTITTHLLRQRFNIFDKGGILIFCFFQNFIVYLLGLLGMIKTIFEKGDNKLKFLAKTNLVCFISIFILFSTFYFRHLLYLFPFLFLFAAYMVFKIFTWLSKRKQIFVILIILIFFIAIQVITYFSWHILPSWRLNGEALYHPQKGKLISYLKRDSGYLYTGLVFYVLESKREVYPWYYALAPCMIGDRKLSSQTFIEIFKHCSNILIDHHARWVVPSEALKFVKENMKLIYKDQYNELYYNPHVLP